MTTRHKVMTMYEQGYGVREMAALCGVSTQRVYQILESAALPAPSKKDDDEVAS